NPPQRTHFSSERGLQFVRLARLWNRFWNRLAAHRLPDSLVGRLAVEPLDIKLGRGGLPVPHRVGALAGAEPLRGEAPAVGGAPGRGGDRRGGRRHKHEVVVDALETAGLANADRVVRKQDEVQGKVEKHELDVTIQNSQLMLAALALSFEKQSVQALQREYAS